MVKAILAGLPAIPRVMVGIGQLVASRRMSKESLLSWKITKPLRNLKGGCGMGMGRVAAPTGRGEGAAALVLPRDWALSLRKSPQRKLAGAAVVFAPCHSINYVVQFASSSRERY
jgi:hypothetical protein